MREVASPQLLAQSPVDVLTAVADRARQMAAGGHGLHDIAAALRTHPAQVTRWLTVTDHNETAALHARAWTIPTSRSEPHV